MRSIHYAIALAVTLSAFAADAQRPSMPAAQPEKFIKAFGAPSRDISTERDKPRPLFVTRFIDYKKANVRFGFLADAPVGSPPPYRGWLYMGAIDITKEEKISQAEAEKRLGKTLPL